MILHLYQEIPYLFCPIAPEPVDDIATVYSNLLQKLDDAPIGSEACLEGTYDRTEDAILFSVTKTGWANPPDETIRKAVQEGTLQPMPPQESIAFSIPANDYRFAQLPWTPEGNSLVMTLLPFFASPAEVQDRGGVFYLRLIKENVLEVVAQVLAPLA